MYIIYKDWYGNDEEEKFKKITMACWPFALNTGIVAIFYRMSGVLLDRTTGVGEVLIAEGD